MDPQPELLTMDLSFSDMVKNIYKAPPMDPFSVHFEFLDEINKDDVKKYLANFIMEGASIRYNKQLAELTPEEIKVLSDYLHSIGWDVSFEIESRKQVLNGKETMVNYYMIDFFPYDISKAKFVAGKF
jgi:hypothetical protein